MSNIERPPANSGSKLPQPLAEENPSQGPNLILLYGLLALALIAAIGFALLIVLPFYHRR